MFGNYCLGLLYLLVALLWFGLVWFAWLLVCVLLCVCFVWVVCLLLRCLNDIGWLLMISVGLNNLRFGVVFLLDVACLGFACVIVCLWC